MKKFLLFVMMCVCVSIGTWAGTISSSNGTITLDGLSAGDLKKALTDQSVWTSGNAADLATATKVVFGSDVELNDEDLAALKTLIPAATQLDMANAQLEDGADFAKLETQDVQYLRLPDGFTEEADVTKMATLNSKNTALKVVGAFDGSNETLPELALYSFAANELSNFSNQMMDLADKAMVARLAGSYGDKDLVNSGPVFGWTPPCIWDFTGATFSSCTVDPGVSTAYYAYNDPFCLGTASKPSSPYQTNSFFYFSNYSTKVVDIKLPTGITALPPHCLNDLGGDNVKLDAHKAAYKAYYDVTDDDLNGDLKIAGKSAAVIPTLTIPNNYTLLDYECGAAAHIQHLVVGNGVKIVQGGAFNDCLQLEDLDFGAGLSNCYLGDRAFHGQNNSVMKHIALSEGIVSLGYQCFQNAQHLESIRLPQSLKYIGNHSFNNCLALNSITIPENVEKIGQGAFILCPFTDIYLTTTDPTKIPEVWSAGTKFTAFDGNCTFHHGHLDGWEGGVDAYKNDIDGKMTWDEAAPFYYMNWNGMPVLHFPSQLADKVRSSISSQYAMKTKADANGVQYGLPLRVDMDKRDNIPGADLGTSGTGKYTQDGWAQFMLMKEMAAGPGSEIYQKEYDDVWYTMCFPFDLTDEQLAAAFNETFNIVDFSGVEVKEAEGDNGKMKLILHFNNVAVTDYKDTDGKHYKRKLSNGSVIREKDETSKFEYNVYLDDNNVEYHHVTTSSQLSSNKTKTFAPGNTMAAAQAAFNANHDVAVMIDGVLATAGHPYMIHPAIGVVAGQPKQRCTFAGIEWLPQGISFANWENVFKEKSRTIDLGEDLTVKTDSNYNHPGYAGYEGQKYTFIGNAKEYRADAGANIPDEPQVPEKPTEPVAPPQPTETLSEPTERVLEPTPLTADEQELVSKLTEGNGQYERGVWFGEDYITASYNDGSTQANNYNSGRNDLFFPILQSLGYNPYGSDADKEAGFNYCKSVFNKNKDYAADYAAYLENKALWDAYDANQAAWARYNAWQADNGESEWAVYRPLKQAYDDAVAAHDAWVANAEKWKTFIPKNAYFLGRKTGQLPKYYRETADDPAEGQPSTRTGGVWSQFSAIVIPNEAALNGIEKGISSAQAHSKGFDMLFNEDFEGTYIDGEDEGVATAIEEAKKAGADVKYVDIVVSINGQVVRRGSTSIEGLPRGMYIINGKKYFVK